MGGSPEKLAPAIEQLRELAAKAGKPAPEVVYLGGLPTDEPQRGAELLNALADIGVTRFVAGSRYADVAEFQRGLDTILAARQSAGW